MTANSQWETGKWEGLLKYLKYMVYGFFDSWAEESLAEIWRENLDLKILYQGFLAQYNYRFNVAHMKLDLLLQIMNIFLYSFQ